MSILIKGMEMPDKKNGAVLIIYPDGKCAFEDGKTYQAVPVPPHGRLIDGDRLAEEQKENARAYHAKLITLNDLAECLLEQSISEHCAPTIIPAEEGETRSDR